MQELVIFSIGTFIGLLMFSVVGFLVFVVIHKLTARTSWREAVRYVDSLLERVCK